MRRLYKRDVFYKPPTGGRNNETFVKVTGCVDRKSSATARICRTVRVARGRRDLLSLDGRVSLNFGCDSRRFAKKGCFMNDSDQAMATLAHAEKEKSISASAAANIRRWLTESPFAKYRDQLVEQISRGAVE